MPLLTWAADGRPIVGQDCTAEDFTMTFPTRPTSEAAPGYVYTSDVAIITGFRDLAGQQVRAVAVQQGGLPAPAVTMLTPSTEVLIDANGYLTKYSVGTVEVNFRVVGATGTKLFSTSLDPSTATYKVTGYERVPGTMVDTASLLAVARTSGKTQGDASQRLFTSATFASTAAGCAATENANCIVPVADYAHVTFCRYESGQVKSTLPYALVGPRHVVFGWHVGRTVGQTCIFRRANGSFTQANLVAVADLGNDMGVGLLDADITGIEFARILTNNYLEKMNALHYLEELAMPLDRGVLTGLVLSHNSSLNLSAARHAQLLGFATDGMYDVPYAGATHQITFTQPIDNVGTWYSQPYPGDSSSPLYMLIQENGVTVPVLLAMIYTTGGGPSLTWHSGQIEAWFASQGQPFTFRRADLSAYPNL